jgi:hypothetical protein
MFFLKPFLRKLNPMETKPKMLDPKDFRAWSPETLAALVTELGGNPQELLAAYLATVPRAQYEEYLLTKPEPYERGFVGPPRPRLVVKTIDELVDVAKQAAARSRPGWPRVTVDEIYPDFWRDVGRRSSVGNWTPAQREWLRSGLTAIANGTATSLPPRPEEPKPQTTEELLAVANRAAAENARIRRALNCQRCGMFLPFGGACPNCAPVAVNV